MKGYAGTIALIVHRTVCAALVCAMGLGQLHAQAKPGASGNGWRIVAHYRLDGTGVARDVAVDPTARRLYVAHGKSIEVLDADSGAKAGEIACDGEVRGIAIAPKLKRGFAANSAAGSITIFSTGSFKVLQVVLSGGKEPDAVVYDDGNGRVYVANSASGSVTVLDAASGKVLSTIDMGGRLRQMAASGYGRLYVAVEDRNVVHVVDTGTSKFLGDFPLDAGKRPSGLSLDPAGRRLFVACEDGALAIVDTDIGFTFEQLPIGSGASGSTFASKPAAGWKGAAFVATADGKLSFVRMDAFISYSSSGSLKLQPGIQSVAFDADNHHLFLPTGTEILVVGSDSCQECKQ